MKELSIEEKARRYDKAIEIAKKINNEHKAQPFDVMLKVFPELAKSEDEKIRKAIKKALQVRCDGSRIISDEPVTLEEAIAWLEKQGEQKTVDEIAKEVCKNKTSAMTFLKSAGIMNEKGELADEYKIEQGEQKSIDELNQQEAMDVAVAKCFEWDEQKPTNKVEPKLNVEEGNWYVCTNTFTLKGKIVVIKGQTYKSNQDGAIEGEDEYLFIDKLDGKASDYFRPWTIHDAKDGEILVFGKEKHPFIFKGLLDKSHPDNPVAYCGIDCDNKFFIPTGINWWTDDDNIHPATKEQCNFLFQQMHEALYEWNAEKKELEKIEQKPAWSEEDEKILDRVITNYESGYLPSVEKRDEIIEKLKSLRLQNTWKPSELQIEALNRAMYHVEDDVATQIAKLIGDLKKLREK